MAATEVIHFPWRVQLRVYLLFPDELPFEPACLLPPDLPGQREVPCPFRCGPCDPLSISSLLKNLVFEVFSFSVLSFR
jgi:hypothetical protein